MDSEVIDKVLVLLERLKSLNVEAFELSGVFSVKFHEAATELPETPELPAAAGFLAEKSLVEDDFFGDE